MTVSHEFSKSPEPVLDESPDIDSSSKDYANRFSGDIGKWFLSIQSSALERALSGEKIKTVLDAGGGHGQNIETLQSLGCRVEILGSSPECASLVAGSLDSDQLTFQLGSLLNFPYPDNSFDAVVSFRMLAHLQNWQQHIAELCRVSRGLVVVDFPVTHSVNALAERLFFLKQAVETNTRKYQLFAEAELSEIFVQNNYQQSARYPQYFFPMALYRAVKLTPLAKIMEGCAGLLGLTRALGSPIIAAYRAAELPVKGN